MINVFSKRAYRRVFIGVAIITVVSMMLSGVIFVVLRTKSRSSFMTINHHQVSVNDFKRRTQAQTRKLEMLRMQFEQAGIPFDPRMLGIDLKQAAVQSLIADELLNETANDLNINLGYQYVATKITDPNFLFQEMGDIIPPYLLAQGNLDFNALSRVLRAQGLSVADFESQVEEHLKLRQVKELIAASLYTPSFLIKSQYMQQFAGKKYSVLTIPFEQVMTQERAKAANDAELRAHYDEAKKQFAVPEMRSGSVWEFDPANYNIKVSDQNVTQHYDANKASYTQSPAQVQIRRIVFKVDKAEDANIIAAKAEAVHREVSENPTRFAEKAKEVSDDKVTAKEGGMVGFISRGGHDPMEEQAAFTLKADGEVSQIFQTKDGFEIVQRVARKAATYKPMESVRAEIEKAVRQTLFNRLFSADMERIQHELGTNPQALEQFAQSKGAKRSELANVKLDKDAAPEVERLFKLHNNGELSIMTSGKNVDGSDTEQVGSPRVKGGALAKVIALTKVNKSYVPPFEQIKEKVTQALYRKKAQAQMRVLLAQAKQQAGKRSLGELAQEFHGSVKAIDWLKGDETDKVKKLSADGLPVNQMLPMEKVGSVITNVDEHGNGLIVKLEGVEPFNAKDFEAKKASFQSSIDRELSGRLIQSFIASLERSATISVHPEAEADQQPYYPIDEI